MCFSALTTAGRGGQPPIKGGHWYMDGVELWVVKCKERFY